MSTMNCKSTLSAVVVIATGFTAGVSQAALDGYTDVSSFEMAVAQLGGSITTHGFDSSPTGAITLGSTIDGITFESASLLGSGGVLAINDGPQPTKSPLNQVGNTNGADQGQLLDGDSFTIGVGGVFALGMYFNFAGTPNLDDIFGFTVTVNQVERTFRNDPTMEDLGSSTYAYFVGVVESTGAGVIDSAVVSVPNLGGSIEFSVDDIKTAPGLALTLPVPATVGLFLTALGIAGAVRVSPRS